MADKYVSEIDGNLLGLEVGEVLKIKDESAYVKPSSGIPKSDLNNNALMYNKNDIITITNHVLFGYAFSTSEIRFYYQVPKEINDDVTTITATNTSFSWLRGNSKNISATHLSMTNVTKQDFDEICFTISCDTALVQYQLYTIGMSTTLTLQ